jgi:hypothetical protein
MVSRSEEQPLGQADASYAGLIEFKKWGETLTMKVCLRCGSTVAQSSVRLHDLWHAWLEDK